MTAQSVTIRPLTAADNIAAAGVIKTVMPEFGCVGEGYSIEDPEMDDLYATYSLPRSQFYVAEIQGADAGAKQMNGERKEVKTNRKTIIAVGGYAPLAGAAASICELRKMYALPAARGLGIGRMIMEKCLRGAKKDGFKTMYLETVTAMTAAAEFYRKYGFEYIEGPMGSTGHSGCDRFMTRAL